MAPSCGEYEACFAKYCPCDGDQDEYFISYGKKYCSAFLNDANLSDQGKRWRDKTLVCLQEKIVPKLDISNHPSCDCSAMKAFAFDVHVACYTQPGASICDLPDSDVARIAWTVDFKDMFGAAGVSQMRKVSAICATSAPDDGRRARWNALSAALGSP